MNYGGSTINGPQTVENESTGETERRMCHRCCLLILERMRKVQVLWLWRKFYRKIIVLISNHVFIFLSVFPPNIWYCCYVEQHHVCYLDLSQYNNKLAQSGSKMGDVLILASTVVLYESVLDIDIHFMTTINRHILLEMVTCTRNSISGLRIRN